MILTQMKRSIHPCNMSNDPKRFQSYPINALSLPDIKARYEVLYPCVNARQAAVYTDLSNARIAGSQQLEHTLRTYYDVLKHDVKHDVKHDEVPPLEALEHHQMH